MAAFQKAEDVQQTTKVNQERQSQLLKEVAALRETLDQVKLASLQAQEKYSKIIAEKEACLLTQKSAMEETEMENKPLKGQYDPEENLDKKLKETTKAIKILMEQLYDVRASDLYSLQIILSELDRAKKAQQEVVAEENSIRSSMDSLKLQLEEVKREPSEPEKKASEAKLSVERVQSNLEKKTELEEAISDGLQSTLEKLYTEAEKARHEAAEIRKNAELLKQEAEATRIAAKKAEEKIQIALKEAEAAKAAEKLADDQIRNSLRIDADDLKGSGSVRKIRLSVEEFELMNKKIKEFRNQADEKVATAMAQLETINATEKEEHHKVDAILKENEDKKSEA